MSLYEDDSEVEHVIPVSLQVDASVEHRDDDSEQSESQQTDSEPSQFKTCGTHPFSRGNTFGTQWNPGSHDPRSFASQYGWYTPMPPTINIFACPPPPPPSQYNMNGYTSVFRPRVVSAYPREAIPQQQGYAVNVPSNIPQPPTYFQENQHHPHISGVQTPPPPDLSEPFHCEESKANTTAPTLIRTKTDHVDSRFHPYNHDNHDTSYQRVKREPDRPIEKKSYLFVDTQDFDANEISIKVKDKTLTIEGTKSTSQNHRRISSMKQEFTFTNSKDAKSTSCTFHPNGTLVLQFNHETDITKDNSHTCNTTS